MSLTICVDPLMLRRLLRARDCIDGAPDEEWPVSRLRRVSGISEAHFARSFKQAFDIPPHRYLLTRRIERAKALLRDTDRSQVNRARAIELLEAGRVRAGGLAQIEAARADGRWEAAYAPASNAEVPADLQAALDRNSKAATFFAMLTGASRYAIFYRIGAVKKPQTRARKIAEFIAMLERHETVHG